MTQQLTLIFVQQKCVCIFTKKKKIGTRMCIAQLFIIIRPKTTQKSINGTKE